MFNGSEAIRVRSFLPALQMPCDTNIIRKGTVMRTFYFRMSKPAGATLNTCTYLSISRQARKENKLKLCH